MLFLREIINGDLAVYHITMLERVGDGLENQEYGRRDPLCWSHNILYPQKLALTSPTSSGRLVGIVRSRTEATSFVCLEDRL
jgi:hypothetical protein